MSVVYEWGKTWDGTKVVTPAMVQDQSNIGSSQHDNLEDHLVQWTITIFDDITLDGKSSMASPRSKLFERLSDWREPSLTSLPRRPSANMASLPIPHVSVLGNTTNGEASSLAQDRSHILFQI